MIALIVTETAFFTIFVTAYVFYIGKSLTPPYPRDVLSYPVFNTICLLSSSITIALASRALNARSDAPIRDFMVHHPGTRGRISHRNRTRMASAYLSRRTDYTDQSVRHDLLFTGRLHAVHVTIGALAIALVMVLTLAGAVTQEHAERIEMLSWYWHFVDAVWIVVFLTVYVIGTR